MDRIFVNRQTGEMILSVENGMMGRGVMADDPDWTQVGSLDMHKLISAAGPNIPREIKGRLTIS